MAQQADGTVYIDTLLDTTGFKAGGKDVEAAVRRMSKTVSGIGDAAKIALQKQTDAFVKQNQAYAQQEQKVESLRQKLEEMSNQKVETSAFREIEKQIDSDTEKLNRLQKAQEEFLAIGGKETSSAYKRRELEIEELRNSIKYAKSEQEDLINSGGAYKPVDTSGVEQKLIAEEQRLQQMDNSLSTSYQALKEKIRSYNTESEKTVKTEKRKERSFGTSLKTILKYSLGIRSLHALFSKLRGALTDGIKNIAQYDGQTNASISSLKSALTQLKNSFATAFSPILTVVAPALTAFIDMVSRAVTYVGMLIAALSGATTFKKAVAVQENYAASLGDTAKNAKEAEKYLSGLDEIRTYSNKNESAGGGGFSGPTPGEMFETVPIEDKIKQFADKVKQIFSEMFESLRKSWDKYGKSIMATLEKIKNDFIDFGKEVAGSTFTWFKDLNWDPLLSSIDILLKKLEPLVDLILDGLAWAWENVLLPFGKWTIEEALPAALTAIGGALELIAAVASTAAPWLQAIWDNFLAPVAGFVGDVFAGFLETLGRVLSDIAQNEAAVTVVTGLATAIGLVTVAIAAWNAVQAILNILLTANPIGLVIAAIGALIAVIILCITYWDEIVAKMKEFDQWMQGIFQKDWSQSFGYLGNIINDFFDLVEIVWNLVKGVFEGVIQFFKGVFAGNWSEAWSGIEKIFSSAWEAIKGVASVAVNFVKDIVSFGWNSIKTVTSTIWNGGIKPLLSNTWNWIKDTASNIFNGIKNNLSNTWNLVKTGASAVWSGIKKTLSNIWSGIKNTASNVFSGIQNTISNAWNTVSNIIGNLKNIFNDVKNAASNTVSNIVSFFSNIRLPSIPMPHFSVGTETVSILGKSFSIPSVSVDWYAQGGLFNQPSLIGVGEAGKEAVLPLENRKTMSAIANSIVANLPKPYLASGAVVPPKAQYSTVNIETSRRQEMDDMYSMLRDVLSRLGQTVGNGEKGGTYTFIGQINRRTLFEEMMTEAQLVRDRTGRNPYEMA